MTRRQYMPGEAIIREGDIGEEFFLISDGEVQVERQGQEIARLGSGAFFGELALLTGEPRTADAIAAKPVDAYILNKPGFEAGMEARHSFREQLSRGYCQRHRGSDRT